MTNLQYLEEVDTLDELDVDTLKKKIDQFLV